MIKIHNGTPDHSTQSLCVSCREGLVVEGQKESDRVTYCTMLRRNVPFIVTACGSYEDKSLPSLWDMRQIAHRIVLDKSGVAGFLTPAKFHLAVEDGKVERDPD